MVFFVVFFSLLGWNYWVLRLLVDFKILLNLSQKSFCCSWVFGFLLDIEMTTLQ